MITNKIYTLFYIIALIYLDNVIQEIQAKISDAFDIFDHEKNKTVDVREVGTVIRSLGCCPSEAELHDLLTEVFIYL